MDYEKAYKALVAKVKNAHLYAQTDSTKNVLENILPELRESKDERIGNLIYCLIRDRSDNQKLLEHNGVSVDEALAYLEKQKVIDAIPDELIENYKLFYENGRREAAVLINAINSINEQKEQKPAEWSEEDKQHRKWILECLHTSASRIPEYAEEFQAAWLWLKALPERFNLQPKVEWSEEDEKMVQFWNMYYEHKVGDWPNKDVVEHLERFKEWLNNRFKSLRPEPKGKWEKRLEEAQARWKPSKEQMETLLGAKGVLRNLQYNDWAKILAELYEQLKQL